MAQELTPDICVIGAGAGDGGRVAAAAAAVFGVPVVLIEQRRDRGGVPAYGLIAAAKRAHALRHGAAFGLKDLPVRVDFAALRSHVRDVADAVAANDTKERFAALGVRVIEAEAHFTGPRSIAADDFAIKARRTIIAIGSSPALPAIPGLAGTAHVTAATVFDLAECPRHLIVIGAGSTGLELAQAFRRLGAEVTVLEAATPLAHGDPECAAVVLDALCREGVTLRAGVEITRVHRELSRIKVDIATPAGAETIEGTHLLVAAGRRPNLESLDLDRAGIRYEPRGIVIDKRLRTTNKRVYAVGDVTAGPKFAHLADYQAELVIRHVLSRQRVAVDHHGIPAVTYTDPELAQVGLLEDEARAHCGVIRVLRWPYRENHRALAERATKGHIKIVTDRRGNVLGVTIVGAQAGENLAAWTLAISQKLNISAVASLIVPYASYGEVGKRAAMTYFAGGLTSSRVRRIMGWLRRLG